MKTGPRYPSALAPFFAVLSGILLAFALPPRDFSFLGWIAFVPLLIACRMVTRPLLACGLGLLTAATCAGVLAGRWSDPIQYAALVVPFGSLALVIAFVSLTAFCSFGTTLWPTIIGCAGVTAELISTLLFPVNVAITQDQTPLALYLASFTGIWGVSWLVWFTSAAVTVAFTRPRELRPVSIAAVIVAAAVLAPFPNKHDGRTVRVAAIQALDPFAAVDETAKLPKEVKLVVWPEHLMNPEDALPYDTARTRGVYLAVSVLERKPGTKPQNGACLISPDGKPVGKSYKQHLFGVENKDYVRGPKLRPTRCGDLTVGLPICFDTMFTDVTRRLVRQGANMLLVPNADPDLPGSLFNRLHSAFIPFRAAENGVPIVWAECSGLSAVYDSHGRRLVQAPTGTTTFVQEVVTPRTHRTMFNIAGDYFAYVCAAGVVFMLAHRRKLYRV